MRLSAYWVCGRGRCHRRVQELVRGPVRRVVNLLEHQGVALGEPYASAIQSSKHALRELRVQSKGRPIRIFYAFDPLRQAVLLIAGDKTGDSKFYEVYVAKAEKIWQEYLAELKSEGRKAPGRDTGR